MAKPCILIRLDTDRHPSVFDGVVAVDSGVDFLFQYGDVKPEDVRPLVHGAMFTRGPADLHRTAIFVGGGDVELGRRVAESARRACFDPFRVSIMHDSNGSNSTAAAAVLSAAKHVDLANSTSLILAGTGAVGQAVASLIAGMGGTAIVASRKLDRATECCASLAKLGCDKAKLRPLGMDRRDELVAALSSSNALFGCGAAGVELLSAEDLKLGKQLRAAVDLNAVPPAGIAGISVSDHAVTREGRIDYGALGVGGLKMKIHKAAIRELFASNTLFIDAHRMLEIGRAILSAG